MTSFRHNGRRTYSRSRQWPCMPCWLPTAYLVVLDTATVGHGGGLLERVPELVHQELGDHVVIVTGEYLLNQLSNGT